MPKLYEQASSSIYKNRKIYPVTSPEVVDELLGLAVKIEKKVQILKFYPSPACATAVFMMMRIRSALQSIALLRTHNLIEETFIITRKGIEVLVVLVNTLALNEMTDYIKHLNRFQKRINFEQESARVPYNKPNEIYNTYKQLSTFVHANDNNFKFILGEIIDPGNLRKDIDEEVVTREWFKNTAFIFQRHLEYILNVLIEMYYIDVQDDTKMILRKFLNRYISRELYSNAIEYQHLLDMDFRINEFDQSTLDPIVSALRRASVLNEDNTAGSILLDTIKEEITPVYKEGTLQYKWVTTNELVDVPII